MSEPTLLEAPTSGKCQICGCTEDHACRGGCAWVDQAQMYCSQCVAWATLKAGNPYAGILPHDLFPVRTLSPVMMEGKPPAFWPIDMRRIDPEAQQRIVFFVAPMLGMTAQELLESVTSGEEDLGIEHAHVRNVFVTFTPARAAEMRDRYESAGHVPGTRILKAHASGRITERRG